jgi:hypothetical protein
MKASEIDSGGIAERAMPAEDTSFPDRGPLSYPSTYPRRTLRAQLTLWWSARMAGVPIYWAGFALFARIKALVAYPPLNGPQQLHLITGPWISCQEKFSDA